MPFSRANASKASSLRSASTSSSRETPSWHATLSTDVSAIRSIVSPSPSAVEALAGCAGIRDGSRLERPAAEREVRDHDCRDEPEGDEERHEASHSGRLRTKSSGTSAHSVSAAARRNGPENALVTARSS